MKNPGDIQAQVTEFEAALTGRKDLTDHAKRVTAARNRQTAGQQLAELQAAELGRRATVKRSAERKLYGGTSTDPAAIMLRRDAAERARAIDDPQALRQSFDDAQRDGDGVMAQALAVRAREVWAFDVFNEYVASNPQAQTAMEELQELPAETEQFNLHEAATYSLPAPTGVLSGLADHQISAYASDDLEVA